MKALFRIRWAIALATLGAMAGCQDEKVAIGEPGMQGTILRDKAKAEEVKDHTEAAQKEGEGVAYGN